MPIKNFYPPKNKKLFNLQKTVDEIFNGKWVKKAISIEICKENKSELYQEKKAKAIIKEIANDMNFKIIKTFAFILRKIIWKWLFEKIEVHGVSKIQLLSKKNYQIIYVPNHRSHIDYLMMLDAIAKNNLLPPVMAAGMNLNFFPVGYFLRKGCAFFVRRSFNGDKFYSAIMKEYVHYILKQKIPLSFFPEGGRSRSGKLLTPKLGFFSFVVQSYLRSPDMKIVFVPAYIGYDRVVESKTYEKELAGSNKKKESLFRFIKFFKHLKKRHGSAYLSFGEPLFLEDFLEKNLPVESSFSINAGETLKKIEENNPKWYWNTIDKLGRTILMRINQSAVVSIASMVSLALVNAEGQTLKEDHLHNFINKMISLRKFSNNITNISFPSISIYDIMKKLEGILPIKRYEHIVDNKTTNEIKINKKGLNHITYILNNIFHLFALESFIARLFLKYKELDLKSITEHCTNIYPRIKEEFYLPWNLNQIHEVLIKTLDGMEHVGLLQRNKNGYKPMDINNINFKYLQILNSAYLTMYPGA